MRFLVVDDSATMRRIVQNALQRIGYIDAIEAADGYEALAKFDSTIGFIITDWDMPMMNGLELARAVRAMSFGENVPILIVTKRGAHEDFAAAVDAGVSNYILKPFAPS